MTDPQPKTPLEVAIAAHNRSLEQRGWRALITTVLAGMMLLTIGFGTGLYIANTHAGNNVGSALRDPFTQPFTSTSIWNQPIGGAATYSVTGVVKPPTIKTLTVDNATVIQDPTAPATAIKQNGGQHSNTCTVTGGTLATDPIPSSLVIPASNANGGFAIVKADGQSLQEGGAFARCVAGTPATADRVVSYGTIYGDGLAGGSGGSGLSILGGILRPGEIAPGKAGAPHALRLNVDCANDCWPGSPGYRWPATKKDGYAYSPGGTNPAMEMGSLLAIPQTVDITKLGLSPAGLELAWTLENYGAYVANDSARSVFTVAGEQGDANTAATFQSQWGFPLATSGVTGAGWNTDVRTIIANLAVVTNNTPTSIGGGGTPLQPLAPPLGTGCGTSAGLTAAYLAAATPTPAFDPDGDGDDDFVDPSSGEPTPTPSATPTPTPTATPTPTPTPTATPSPSATPSPTACPTPTPTVTPTGTPTPSPTGTPTPTATATPTPSPTPTGTPPPGTQHVLVIQEENKGYSATLGACSADPFLCSLAANYASASSWYGISHPSEPNYVGEESGGIQGCTTDSSCAANSLSATDLGGQLTAKGVPWVGWMESMPSACYTGSGSGGYVLKHSFGGFFKDEYTGTCHIIPYPGATSAVSSLDGANAPDFVWISPNLTDDMHDGTVQQGDAWLKANLGPILASSWFTGFNSTVVIQMDEGDGSANSGSCCGGGGAGGHVPEVIISSNAQGKGTVSLTGDNYGTLRSIEEAFGLSLLGNASNAANGDLSALFG